MPRAMGPSKENRAAADRTPSVLTAAPLPRAGSREKLRAVRLQEIA